MEDETMTFTVQLKGPVARRFQQYTDSERRSKSNAAAVLIERGLDAEAVRMAADSAPGAVTK